MTAVGKIWGIMLSKNEADIIGASIEDALRWSDAVIVYDSMSTDGTWEIVQELATRDSRVIPWKRHDQPFRDGLRGEVYQAFRALAGENDWWCRLDSDEFYVDDPRVFLGEVSRRHHVVWSLPIEYFITRQDLAAIDFSAPFEVIRDSLKYYKVHTSEARFFRHRAKLEWPLADPWPRHMGVSAPKRIRLKHYRYRSPKQIQMRLDVRREARARGFKGWISASQEDWRVKIFSEKGCFLDDGSGNFHVDESILRRHLEGFPRRPIKYIMHGLGIWP